MAESTASSAASWMPSMWSAIEATNTEHDIKRKEKAAKKALVMLLDQSDQTQEVNLMPSLLKGTLSELNQEQEKRKVSKAKKKESKKKRKAQEEMLENGGGLSALFGMYSSVSGNGDSSVTVSSTSASSSSDSSTAVRSPGLSSSKATDSSSISSSTSYITEFDFGNDSSIATTSSTSERVLAGQLQHQEQTSNYDTREQAQSPPSSLSSIPTTATPTNTTPPSASPLTLPSDSAAATASAPVSPMPTKESILLQIVQIKQQQKQDEDAFIEASRTIMATQPQLQIQLAAMHQQKSRKLIAQELALLQQLQTLQQVTAIGATASIADATTAPNATVALQLSNKRRQQHHQLQLLQEQQEQALALNQLATNGITANANVLANAQLAHVRPPKRQRTTVTQQLQQAFFNNCPSMSEQTQNFTEYTLPLTLPLMFRVGAFTTFAQLWCLVIVVGHTLETVFTNFGPNTRKLRLSDKSAKIEPLVHHLIDCGWLHTFISCMFLYPSWFSTDTTLSYWMAVGLVQTLPIYLSVSFKSHYLNGQVKGEVDMKKSQLIELRLMDCFTYYGVSTLCFVLYRRVNCFALLGNGKALLYLGVLLFDVAPLYLTWAYHKQYETVKKEKSTTCIKTGRIVKYKDEKVEQHEMQLEMPQRLPVLVEEEEGTTKQMKLEQTEKEKKQKVM